MGVFGEHTGSGIGVYGSSPSGTGLSGSSTSGTGVDARSSTGAALRVEGRTYFQSGNVGIGISSPVSKLHVSGNYVQLPIRTGAPPPTDCDETREAGRLVVRTDGTPNLYVCRGVTGWRGL